MMLIYDINFKKVQENKNSLIIYNSYNYKNNVEK